MTAKRKLLTIDLKALKDNYFKDWSNIFYDIARKNKSSENILCLDNFQIFSPSGLFTLIVFFAQKFSILI